MIRDQAVLSKIGIKYICYYYSLWYISSSFKYCSSFPPSLLSSPLSPIQWKVWAFKKYTLYIKYLVIVIFLKPSNIFIKDFPDDSTGKESACNVGDTGGMGSIPEWRISPGEGNGNSLQYPCLEKSHQQRSLVGYSPWNHKESDVSEHKACDMTFISMKGNLDLVSQASDISFHYSLNFNHSNLSIFQNQQDLSCVNMFKFTLPVTWILPFIACTCLLADIYLSFNYQFQYFNFNKFFPESPV